MTTLCYIEKDGQYLMLHRTKKEKDINKDKWIGVGGHAEGTEAGRVPVKGSKRRNGTDTDKFLLSRVDYLCK